MRGDQDQSVPVTTAACRPVTRGEGERERASTNLEIRFCVGAPFSFFFQSALSAACQPYRRGWDEVTREKEREGGREKRPIARNRRVSRERTKRGETRGERDTRRISREKRKKKKRKKVNKPGPGFLSSFGCLSFRGEASGGGTNRGEARPPQTFERL